MAAHSYRLTAAGRAAWEGQDSAVPADYRRILWMMDVQGEGGVADALAKLYPGEMLDEWLSELEELGFIERIPALRRLLLAAREASTVAREAAATERVVAETGEAISDASRIGDEAADAARAGERIEEGAEAGRAGVADEAGAASRRLPESISGCRIGSLFCPIDELLGRRLVGTIGRADAAGGAQRDGRKHDDSASHAIHSRHSVPDPSRWCSES